MRAAVLSTTAAPMATPAAAPRRLAAAAPPKGLPRLAGVAGRPRRAAQTAGSFHSAALPVEQVQGGNGAAAPAPTEPEPTYSWFSPEWKEDRRRKKGRTVRGSEMAHAYLLPLHMHANSTPQGGSKVVGPAAAGCCPAGRRLGLGLAGSRRCLVLLHLPAT